MTIYLLKRDAPLPVDSAFLGGRFELCVEDDVELALFWGGQVGVASGAFRLIQAAGLTAGGTFYYGGMIERKISQEACDAEQGYKYEPEYECRQRGSTGYRVPCGKACHYVRGTQYLTI